MRLSGLVLVVRFGPSPSTSAAWSVSRPASVQSACTPMSRLAALTIRERSLVSSEVEPSNPSSANGTRNWPTVPPQRRWVRRVEGSVVEGGGQRGGGGRPPQRAHLDRGAVRPPGGDFALDGEARPPQQERRGVAQRLEARLEVAGDSGGGRQGRGGLRRQPQRDRESEDRDDRSGAHADKLARVRPIGNMVPIGAGSSGTPRRSGAPPRASSGRTA